MGRAFELRTCGYRSKSEERLWVDEQGSRPMVLGRTRQTPVEVQEGT